MKVAEGVGPFRQTDRQKSEPIVLQAEMTERASCWSITINNPTEEDNKAISGLKNYPWFKEFKSQLEQGEEGTTHIQGMLRTTQQRFKTIKVALPRAHIEPAKNATALAKYVEKADTRVAKRESVVRDIPTLFEYQDTVARELTVEVVTERYDAVVEVNPNKDIGDVALEVIDKIVAKHIAEGGRGLEYIAINPMWRSSWKKFWRSIIKRNENQGSGEVQEDECSKGEEDGDESP